MGKGLFSQKTHNIILFLSFALIAIGMPSTKVLMSFGLVFAIANWVLEGGFSEKWQIIRTNRLLQLLIGFYLLIIIGIVWSWEPMQGLKDIKSRLPMLFLPLILATSPPISKKQLHLLLQLFLTSLLVTSLYNMLYFNNIFGNFIGDDIRGLSRFASHIRYGLLVSIGFGICIWFQLINKKFNLFYSILALWFAYYTIYSQVLSGTFSFISVIITTIFFLFYQWKKSIAYTFVIILACLIGWVASYVLNLSHEHIDCNKLPKVTKKGYPYKNSCNTFSEINGKAILTYYSEIELFHEWMKVSEMDFMGLDKNGELLRMTTARYMTSLNLTKDAEGLNKLTKEDIKNIENGYTYRNEKNELIMPRIYGLKYQILNNQYPNGHSLLQRIEHWKTSVFIIKRYWLTGVGTGGNQKAFDWAYNETNSPLNPENRLRSHNMYLTYGVSYGVFGCGFFIIILGVSFYVAARCNNLLSLLFLVVTCGSFLIEDTLETQLGVTMFGFFMGITLLFDQIKKNNHSDK